MRWSPEKDQILLIKILETSDINPNSEAIANTWPGDEAPTPRAVKERIYKIRQMIPTAQSGEGADDAASGQGADNTQTTPKTPKAAKAPKGPKGPKTPKTPKAPKTPKSAGSRSKKRKLTSLEPKVEEEEDTQPEWENDPLDEENKRILNEIRNVSLSEPSFWDASQVDEA